MKKLLFVAIIIAQLTGSLEGILMDGKECISAVEKELKQENTDEPEILVRAATRIIIAGFLAVAQGNEMMARQGQKIDVPQKTSVESAPLFIRHRCLRV